LVVPDLESLDLQPGKDFDETVSYLCGWFSHNGHQEEEPCSSPVAYEALKERHARGYALHWRRL
jgi:hypothetical protein